MEIPTRDGDGYLSDMNAWSPEIAKVMAEADGFGEVFIQVQRAGDGAGDLGDFQCMGQAGPVMVAQWCNENLSLMFQPAEGFRVQDAVAVALESGTH